VEENIRINLPQPAQTSAEKKTKKGVLTTKPLQFGTLPENVSPVNWKAKNSVRCRMITILLLRGLHFTRKVKFTKNNFTFELKILKQIFALWSRHC